MIEPIFAFTMPGFGELLIILLVVLLIFGGSKIPEIARSLGKGIQEFKKATRDDSKNQNGSPKN